MQDLYKLRAREILLSVFDGPSSWNKSSTAYIRKPAAVQCCVVHKIQSTFPKFRVKDKVESSEILKNLYTATCYEEAIPNSMWSSRDGRSSTPANWNPEKRLLVLLTFYKYRTSVRQSAPRTRSSVR